MAGVAWNMVGNRNPVSNFKAFYPIANFNDFSCYFVSEHKRSFFDSVPLHYIAATNTACYYLDKKFSGSNLWNWHFFNSYVFVVVIFCDSHNIVFNKSSFRILLVKRIASDRSFPNVGTAFTAVRGQG